MAGGKTRTLCEAAFSYALEFPGIQILVVRQRHTTIIETTRRSMTRFVLKGLPDGFYRQKQSQGEDWIELFNGSRINFAGLDDPVKWYSAELGCLIVDEAHEVGEGDVVELMTRLRQPCAACSETPVFGEDGTVVPCPHMPCVTLLGFNPASPNHWLNRWFIKGAAQTEFGFYKRELYVKDAIKPKGDCEFVFANAYANPYVSRAYIEQELESLPELKRKRLLEGKWVLTSGSGFFDEEALTVYAAELEPPWRQGWTDGNCTGLARDDRIRVKVDKHGPLAVWKVPVRGEKPHRYIVAVDVSSGGSTDYTGIQVLDIDEFEQVAELQVKLDPDLAAVEAFRLAVIYNGAVIAPEVTGGWGFTVVKAIEQLLIGYKGPRTSKPRMYTRRVEDRLAKKYTDALGWDTNTKTRMPMLDGLEVAIRERHLRLHGERTHNELSRFINYKRHPDDEKSKPQAERGENDDLVISLAIAVYVREQQPRSLRRYVPPRHEALVSATGY